MDPIPTPPNADTARQAIHAIRGYEYQILAAALAWVDLEENGLIYLEVAEDYTHVVGGNIEAVQVKATRGSGAVTLNTPAVRDAIESFVDLAGQNPTREVQLRFLTTAAIGVEKSPDDRPAGLPGLDYWQRVRAGREDVGPLRAILERESSPDAVRDFCRNRTDLELLADLIRRVTWDCDRPETTTLRRELEERVSLFLRKEFGVPPQDAQPVADVLTFRVLQRSALPEVRDRVLSRQDLHQLADSSTRVSLRRKDFESLLGKALVPPAGSTAGHLILSPLGLEHPPWIVDAAALPTPNALVRREPLEALVQAALRASGLCFVLGTTGTGKSTLAQSIAATFLGPRCRVDLRDAEPSEARNRLKRVFVLLAEMGAATVMLEDLNCLATPSVQVSLSEVIGAARRRDMRVIVTSYGRPTATLLHTLGADSGSVVPVPHFDLDETCALVDILGGDPEVWGRVAHLAGGAGHPQLTHAFLAGMAARGWPKHEIAKIVERGFTNTDLEDEHSAARAYLIDSLPEPTRQLLYRLSITTGPFERSLANAIGALQPPIERASERFDELADRWLEPVMTDRYRTSPLVRGFGRKMLTTAQQRRIHEKIATEMTSRKSIDAGDIDTILLHALAGESKVSLFKLTRAINLAEDETCQAIATHLAVFPGLNTSKPIYPKDLPISVMVRLSQLRLVMATEDRRGVEDIVEALLAETNAVPDDPGRPHLEGAVLGSVLNNLGIANDLGNWISLLSRFRRFDEEGAEGIDTGRSELPNAAVLFSIGIAGLESVQKLEAVFDALSAVDDAERREFLTPIDASDHDYHVLIHHPWTAQSRRPGFDPAGAVDIYKRMAAQTDTWGIPTLSVQCHVAVALILDEHLADTAGALRVLDAARTSFGHSSALARALAKLHRRSGHRTEALRFFREAMSQMEMLGPVDAVYTAREAAVCASECGEWDTARTWFLRAQAASDPLDSIGLGAIGVGLLADAAVASFQAGDLRDALKLLKEGLQSLREFEPDSNLQAAHCHRVIRHVILWLQAKVEGRDTKLAGEPIAMVPGACSNPEPVPAIKEQPLGHIDFAWYMLAEIELASGLDVGVQEMVKQKGTQGLIPLSEHALRTQALGSAILAQDPKDFSLRFLDYLATATYCVNNRDAISFNVLDPQRVVIPALPHSGPYDVTTERSAQHAILAYGIQALLVGNSDPIDQLRDSLKEEFGDSHAGNSLLGSLNTATPGDNDLDSEVATILGRLLRREQPSPDLVFQAGLRLPTWIAQSPFKSVVIADLKPWLTAQWERVLRTQRFLLTSPAANAPSIMKVFTSELDGESFAASLTLVAAPAVGARLSAGLRQDLERLVHGTHAR